MSRTILGISSKNVYTKFLEDKDDFVRPEVEVVEIKIFLNRLITLFETTMMRLKFAATLPLIMLRPEILVFFEGNDLQQIVDAFAPFSNTQRSLLSNSNCTSSMENSNCKEILGCCCYEDYCSFKKNFNIKDTTESYKSQKIYKNIYSTIKILLSNPLIYRLSRDCQSDISKSTLNFLRQMRYFIEFIISKTKLMPEKERAKELYLRNICNTIVQTKTDISELTDVLEEQKIKHQSEMYVLSNNLDKELKKWQQINEEYNVRHTKILDESQNYTEKVFKEFTQRMDYQIVALKNIKTKFENEKIRNHKIELDILGGKLKAESQLQSLILKFDSEVGDRHIYYTELMKEYNDLEAEKLQLMNEMDEQEKIYNAIVKEREDAKFAVFREKFIIFTINRSAKIIQRWWRSMRIKLKRDKKVKKKKGRKK